MPAAKLRPLEISPIAPANPSAGTDFLRLAREQGVRPVARLEDLLGGWPAEERDDGFEEALMQWRSLQVQPRS